MSTKIELKKIDINNFPYDKKTKSLRSAVSYLNLRKKSIFNKILKGELNPEFDFPDYWALPKNISSRLSSEDIDFIQYETCDWSSFKNKPKRLTKEQIEQINKKSKSSYIDKVGTKLATCTRYETGGMSGGHYNGSKAEPWTNTEPRPKMDVLPMVLELLKPDITFLQYAQIENMIQSEKNSDGSDYYGNYSNYVTEYIHLDDIYEFIDKLKK